MVNLFVDCLLISPVLVNLSRHDLTCWFVRPVSALSSASVVRYCPRLMGIPCHSLSNGLALNNKCMNRRNMYRSSYHSHSSILNGNILIHQSSIASRC